MKSRAYFAVTSSVYSCKKSKITLSVVGSRQMIIQEACCNLPARLLTSAKIALANGCFCRAGLEFANAQILGPCQF